MCVGVCACACLLTGSARLLGHGQGDLGQREDVDFGSILGGGRGQGGEIRLVLLSLGVLELLVQGHTLQLVTGGTQWPVCVRPLGRSDYISHIHCMWLCVRRCGDSVGAGHTSVSVQTDDTKPHIYSHSESEPFNKSMYLCIYACMCLSMMHAFSIYVYILNLSK